MKYAIAVMCCLLLILGLSTYVFYQKSQTLLVTNEKLTIDLNNAVTVNKDNQETIKGLINDNTRLDQTFSKLQEIGEKVDTSTKQTNYQISKLRKQYEMLNQPYPDDPTINCLFKPSSYGCDKNKYSPSYSTRVINSTSVQTGK